MGARVIAPVVVITGASAGVGRATARAFARRGAAVSLIARGMDGLRAAQREVEELGGTAFPIAADVADASAIEAAATAIEERFGPIDVWINNAMVSVFSPITAMQPDEYRRVTDVTYLGVVHGTLAALRRMAPRNRGTIVQVGSALAYRAIPLQSAYCAAKHAVKGFTESLRCELLHDRSDVRVTMVHLPALNTPQFDWSRSRMPRKARPVPPIFQPEVAARAIAWATDHAPRELYVGWPTVKAIVGNKIAPSYADHWLAKIGYDAQQTDVPEDRRRADNLWQPLGGDHGAHGRFDDVARRSSIELTLATHRRSIVSVIALAAMIAAALRWRGRVAA